jgi:hypothetical protein
MNLRDDQKRLIEEVRLLRECETDFGLPAKPLIDQLVADSDRPPRLQWVNFQWPQSGSVDLTSHWRTIDRAAGPYL